VKEWNGVKKEKGTKGGFVDSVLKKRKKCKKC